MKKIFSILAVSLGLMILSIGSTNASEGRTNLQNVAGGDSSCDAKSALMPDNRYTILITCKDLIYPPTSETNAYVVWATPTGGGNPARLGALGFGRAEFKTQNSFNNLFVSQEKVSQNLSRLTEPGTVVMRGNIVVDPGAPPLFETPTDEILASPTPQPASSLLSRVGTGVVITIISIVVIIIMLVIVKPFK